MEYSIDQPSLRKRESIRADICVFDCHLEWRDRSSGSHAGFVAVVMAVVILLVVAVVAIVVVPPRNVWTGSRVGLTRIGQAIISFKSVRAGGRQLLYIGSDRLPKRLRNLHRRVPSNDIAADLIATRRRDEEAVDIPADLIFLD